MSPEIIAGFLRDLPPSLRYEASVTILFLVFGITCVSPSDPVAALRAEIEATTDDQLRMICQEIAGSLDHFLRDLVVREGQSERQLQLLRKDTLPDGTREALDHAHSSTVLQLRIVSAALQTWRAIDLAKVG